MNLRSALDDHPLRASRDFRALFTGSALVALSQRCFLITVGWWLVTLQGSGGSLVGAFMSANGVAVFASSSIVGPLIDRWDRKWAMVSSALIQATFVAIVGVELGRGSLNVPLVCALGAGVGVAIPLFDSAVVASLARTVEERHVAAATAVQSSTVEFANIFAAALGSSLIAAGGVPLAVGVIVATYIAGSLVLTTVKADLSPVGSDDPRRSYWSEWREGLRAITADRPLLRVFVVFAVHGVLINPIFLLIPVLVNEVLHLSVGWVAAFEVALSSGAVAATAFMSVRRGEAQPQQFLPWLLLATGGLLALAGVLRSPAGLVPVFVLVGAAYAAFLSVSFLALQRRVPDERKGRAFAFLATITAGLAPVSFILAGTGADAFSPGTVLLVAGAGMALLAMTTRRLGATTSVVVQPRPAA
jgi:MFS transporter, DHA3 family, macrolide efflux protein